MLNRVSSLAVQQRCQHMVKCGHVFNEAGSQSEGQSLSSLDAKINKVKYNSNV